MSRPAPVLGMLVALLAALATPRAAAAQRTGRLAATVVHVDDGDTIDVRIADRVERVRYIGIDAPEVVHAARPGRAGRPGDRGGEAAMRLNRALVAGAPVGLELDVERRDHYGRLLAYVWAGDRMVNAEMIARGYARALPIAPNLRHAARFALLESEARANRRGLWEDGGGQAPARRRAGTSRPRIVGRGLVPRRALGSEHLHPAAGAGVGDVGHVRPRLPERHRARPSSRARSSVAVS